MRISSFGSAIISPYFLHLTTFHGSYIGINTQKEKVVACCHLMKETTEVLLNWRETVPDSEYWFPSGKEGHIAEDQLNYTLRKLWIVYLQKRRELRDSACAILQKEFK